MTQAEAMKAGCECAMDVFVRGVLVGTDYFSTAAEAEQEASDRRRRFQVLGCRYVVRPITEPKS